VLADRGRTHARRTLGDATVIDLTAYAEFGVLFSLRRTRDGALEFLDYVIHRPAEGAR